MKKVVVLLSLLSLVAVGAPTAPINIQSTGAATAAQGMQLDKYYLIQCDAAAYILWGNASITVSKTRTDSNFGEPMAAGEKVITKSGASNSFRYVSVISDSGTANCTFWLEVP